MNDSKNIKKIARVVIDDACKLLNIKPLPFELADISTDNIGSRSAVYLTTEEALKVGRRNELIAIDEKFAYNCHELELIALLAHEVRHAYQRKHPEEYNFKNYKRAHEGLIEYATQFVEVDAISFSEIYLTFITEKEYLLKLPPEVRKAVNLRKKDIIKSLHC